MSEHAATRLVRESIEKKDDRIRALEADRDDLYEQWQEECRAHGEAEAERDALHERYGHFSERNRELLSENVALKARVAELEAKVRR